jgi:hypothetical protein
MEAIDYQKQARDLLASLNTKLRVEHVAHDYYFDDDKEMRDIYKVTLSRNCKRISFKFGQSINCTRKGIEPTCYDILASIEKYDPGTFNNFCSEFGYDTDSIKANKTYKAVVKLYSKLCRLFSESELELLREIA